MKKYIAKYISILLMFTTLACSEDFLTLAPETVVSVEDFYQSEIDFQLAIVGVYAHLRPLYGTGLANYGAWCMGEMRSDNTCFIYNTDNAGYVGIGYYERFIDDVNGGGISTKYENDYIIIGRANQVLKYIDDADISEAVRNDIKGQALFLRAFAYFDLVQYFGEVPLVTTPPTSYDETIKPLSSVEDIYTQIIGDASEAANLLPSFAEQERGYVANGAAYTLLGNVYLVLKEWALAEEALKKVEGYSMLDDFAAVFNPDNKNNDELIFSVQYSNDESAGMYSTFAYNFIPNMNNPGNIEGFPDGNAITYAGWNTPTPDLIGLFDTENDLRFDASIAFYIDVKYNNVPMPYVKKYVHGAEISGQTKDDWPVYRYAEVLLMLAEAINEQGGRTSEALSYLNQVHAHPRTGLEVLNITDQAELRDAIQTERQFELAFENKRWTDLVRTGKAVEVMSAHGAKILANPQDYYYPTGITPGVDDYNVSEDKILFPIPNREVRLNPELDKPEDN